MTDRARSHFPFFVVLGLAALFAGCMTRPPAPVIERSPFPSTRALPPPSEGGPAPTPEAAPQPTYTIKRGDTLYQIALDHGLDYRELRYQHPLMGDNNVLQILRILSLHERRHHSQIQDIFRSRQFPKAA